MSHRDERRPNCANGSHAYVASLLDLYHSTKNMGWNEPGMARQESLILAK